MQTTESVAKRALCIGLMAMRAQAENGISYEEGEESEHFRQFGAGLLKWAERFEISRLLSAAELELHNQPLGEWEYGTIFETFWRIEALKALLWSIGLIEEMPSYFAVGNPNAAYSLVPINQPPEEFLGKAKLRSEDVIKAERHQAQFLNWRARTEVLRLQGVAPPPGDSYEATVRRALHGIEQEGINVDHDGVDLLIDGQRLIDLEGETKGDIASICYERQLALEWVCADEADWDQTKCNT
ncbi:hypothetical protein Pan153_57890 [Gimesia panareensis]|uniref:DUF4272 domain-containing protein n=1 Tax=Gimesia panareensis TaxID=2527978 RepID=A0A518FXK4_9PLAN|nr:DUF4272 domain-containing protein [Gimesia panareensis]QDV21107.1 hypothetical protein Pan153_57890 [Gimesia panareensis]